MTDANRTPADAVCALVSGGLDSCALLAHLAQRYRHVYPLFIRQGLRWESAEERALRRFLRAIHSHQIKPLTVIRQPIGNLYGNHWSLTGRGVPDRKSPDAAVYLPGRNLMLLTNAAVFCAKHRIPYIALGSLAHNPFPDASPTFFRLFSRLAARALGQPLIVLAPFRSLSKTDVLRRYRRFPLHLSFSCINPKRGRPCQRCNKCAERAAAYRDAHIIAAKP
ncbi:MAG: 7-cyano-7-deazaguanine synthase [Verrucomicrobiae bacterium]|nr:7-cyano-7-deazaguanine synthase [Verrucomicrobiae bacterium]MDW8343692.1 7-cyano-7-deazaguanine synthase [Verrucomicrobiae bacterium]